MSSFSTNHVAGLARVTLAPINSLVTNHSPRWRAYQKSINNYDAPCIYTPILHGFGEPLDGVTLRFCVHRRSVLDAVLEQKWSNHAEGQQSR